MERRGRRESPSERRKEREEEEKRKQRERDAARDAFRKSEEETKKAQGAETPRGRREKKKDEWWRTPQPAPVTPSPDSRFAQAPQPAPAWRGPRQPQERPPWTAPAAPLQQVTGKQPGIPREPYAADQWLQERLRERWAPVAAPPPEPGPARQTTGVRPTGIEQPEVPTTGVGQRIESAAKAVGGSVMDALQWAPLAIEEAIGERTQKAPAEYGLPSLGKVMNLAVGGSQLYDDLTPDQQRTVQTIAEHLETPAEHLETPEHAYPGISPEQRGAGKRAAITYGVWAMGRQGAPSVQDYALRTYGDTPQVREALKRGRLLAYSPYENQIEAIDRLVGGEDVDTVMTGREVNLFDPTPEEKAAYDQYIATVKAQGGDVDKAVAQVTKTGHIPGSADTWNELAFQFVLDPLNFLDLGSKLGGNSDAIKAVYNVGTDVLGGVMEADEIKSIDDLVAAAKQVDDLPVGWADDMAASATLSAAHEEGSKFARAWDRYNPLAPTSRAIGETASNKAFQVVAPMIDGADSADEAAGIVRQMVENPRTLKRRFGNVPVSRMAEESRPVLAAVVADLDDVEKFPSLYADVFSKADFLADLDTNVAAKAMGMAGVGEQEIGAYRKFASKFKSVMSEFYLGTPGYGVRNAISDGFTQLWDGTLSLASRGEIDDYLRRAGTPTRRIRGMAAGSQELAERGGSALPGIVGQASDAMGKFLGKQEEARYANAFYTGFRTTLDDIWKPVIPDIGLSPAQADEAAEVLKNVLSVDEAVEALGKIDLRLADWAKSDEFVSGLTEAKAIAGEAARTAADFSLLDYVAGQKKFDEALRAVFPYSYWMVRSTVNWVQRLAKQPGALLTMARANAAMKAANRGEPNKNLGTVEIPAPFLPDWAGDSIKLRPLAAIPTQQLFFGQKYQDEDPKNMIEGIYQGLESTGLRPYGYIEWPLRAMGLVGHKSEFGRILPHTAVIQGVTAMLGLGGPTGIDIETPIRRAIGVPEREPYEAYRVNTMISAMAADDPSITETAFLAQELNDRVAMGEITLKEAWEGGANLSRLAEAEGWGPEEVTAAQELLVEAAHRSAVARGFQSIASTGAGLSAFVEPRGEVTQQQLAQEQRAAGYVPLTEEGTQAALRAFQAAHPEAATRGTRYGALPGAREEGEEGYTPGQALRSSKYRALSAEINEDIDTRMAALQDREPWNKDAMRALENERYERLDAAREGLKFPEGEEGVRLSSVYGASPEEVQEIRGRDVMYAVQDAMPGVEVFTDEAGDIDWDAYFTAQDEAMENIASLMRDDEKVAAILADMAERGIEVTYDDLVGKVTPESYLAFKRRNDTPRDAAIETWKQRVYNAAWEGYSADVEAGKSKSQAYRDNVEAAVSIGALDLIDAIQEEYPGRWTDAELRDTLGDMADFPAVGDVKELRAGEEAPAVEEEQQAYTEGRVQTGFWNTYFTAIPPGRMGSGASDLPEVQAVFNAGKGATAAQLAAADAAVKAWAAANRTTEWGSPEEWKLAREQNDQMKEEAEEAIPGVTEIMKGYYAADDRRAYKAAHPEVKAYFDLKDKFATGHPIWAYYYGAKYKQYPRYGRGRGRGRGGGSYYDKAFSYQAGRPPKVFLETPSPWEGALRFERYRYQPTPQWKRGW